MKAGIRDIRERKRQEKLWKMGKRKQKFAHMFLRTFIPFMAAMAIIGLLCTVVAWEAYEDDKSKEFKAYVAELENTLSDRYSEWEEKYDGTPEGPGAGTREGLWKSYVRWTLCQLRFSDGFEHAVALYNTDDKALYCDNSEAAFLIKKSRVSPDGLIRVYECPVEYLEKAVSVVDKYNKQAEGDNNVYESYWYAPQDAYVMGGQFLPGKVDIVKFGTGKYNEVIESYDLTPGNVDGYTRIEIDYMKERTDYFYPMVVGNGKDSISRKNLDGLAAGWASGAGAFNTGDGILCSLNNMGDLNLCYSGNVRIGNGFDKQLFAAASYNIFKDYGNKIYGSYIAAFLLTVLVSLAVSYRNYMVCQAQRRMDAYRRETADAMAHDLKSPLAAVSGFAENLKNNIHTEKREYYVDAILENVQYMNHLIENILCLAKTENMVKAECTEVDLRELVNDWIKKREDIIGERNLQVVLSGEGKAYANELSIMQIIDNLLSNAVKYTRQDGSILIKIMESGFEIANEMESEPGVSVNELWKPFVKGDNSRGGRQGTGIGLTIAKNLAETYGYKLELLAQEDTFVARVKGQDCR